MPVNEAGIEKNENVKELPDAPEVPENSTVKSARLAKEISILQNRKNVIQAEIPRIDAEIGGLRGQFGLPPMGVETETHKASYALEGRLNRAQTELNNLQKSSAPSAEYGREGNSKHVDQIDGLLNRLTSEEFFLPGERTTATFPEKDGSVKGLCRVDLMNPSLEAPKNPASPQDDKFYAAAVGAGYNVRVDPNYVGGDFAGVEYNLS